MTFCLLKAEKHWALKSRGESVSTIGKQGDHSNPILAGQPSLIGFSLRKEPEQASLLYWFVQVRRALATSMTIGKQETHAHLLKFKGNEGKTRKVDFMSVCERKVY